MSYEERHSCVRSVMVRNRVTNKTILDKAEVSYTFLRRVFRGESKGYRVRLIIATECGVPVETIFPDTPEEYRRAA